MPTQKAAQFPLEAKRWLSLVEAAGYLGICPSQFHRTIRKMLREHPIVGSPRFDREEIDKVMAGPGPEVPWDSFSWMQEGRKRRKSA